MKKLTIIATILLSIVCIMTSVYAAESFSITAQMEKDEFSKDEVFTVEFSLSSMQVGEGIISIGATLEYDRESLEIVNKSEQNGWNMTYNDAEKIMLLENDTLIKDDGSLFKITFKVKENSKPNLTIGLKDITAAGAGDEISAANVEKAIVIKSESSNNGGNNSGNNSDDNNNGNNSNNNNNGNNSGNNNNNGNNNGGSSNNGGSNNNSNVNGNNNNENSNNGSNNNNNGGSSNNSGSSNNNANGNNNQNKIISTNDKNQSGSTTNGNKNNEVRIPQAGESDTILFILIGVATVSAVIFFVKAKMANKSEK